MKVSSVTQNNITAFLKDGRRCWGFCSEIARDLGVSRQFVARVAAGKSTSRRVMRAIVRKAKRLNNAA